MKTVEFKESVERWGIQEIAVQGRTEGNPFTDYQIAGLFQSRNETVEVKGFYDGDGIYRVRFMPSFAEDYSFELTGSALCEKVQGSFCATEPAEGNHGPVRVVNGYHFAYEDGTPYYSIGTTCYVWDLQPDERIAETLAQLEDSAFNKIRFCIFPKHYDYNLGEPRSYPYEGTPMDSSVLTKENFYLYAGKAEGNQWDFTRFRPDHFRHIEWCIGELMKRGIETDLIVMHPYDRWGFSQMSWDEDELYWKYVIARFSAYRNVWWSLANEYDFLGSKTLEDWEHYARLLCENDPYRHLRSIHNGMTFYDYTRPWVTHCSIQRQDPYKTAEFTDAWRERYGKPVVLDEIAYEGNIQHGWGNITAQEMVRRFWEAVCRGGYAGHGETYMSDDDVLWWSHGGTLKGESNERLKFLLKIMKETPGRGLRKDPTSGWDEVRAIVDDAGQMMKRAKDYYLIYYSFMRPSFRDFYIDDETEYQVNLIDTWNMTIEDLGIKKGHFKVPMPSRQYMAVQLKKVEAPEK